ncbi:MAG TPA: prephenate dehydrogenase/arogenate dehydrogenase family protein, partial [Clostridiales bacterium]|nr:prephenate dehydrogenase/arogenate dehydrogenase family protein [Clostridiales bacterium]
MKIGIVGLGLIGGSFAKAIKARTEHTVLGADIDKEILSKAMD